MHVTGAAQRLSIRTLMGAMCWSVPLMKAKIVVSGERFLTSSSWVTSLDEVEMPNPCMCGGQASVLIRCMYASLTCKPD